MNCLICGQALLVYAFPICEVCRERAAKEMKALGGKVTLPWAEIRPAVPTDPHPCDPITLAGRDFDKAVDALGLTETWGRE